MFDKKRSRSEYLIKNGVYYSAIFYLAFLLGWAAGEIADKEGLR